MTFEKKSIFPQGNPTPPPTPSRSAHISSTTCQCDFKRWVFKNDVTIFFWLFINENKQGGGAGGRGVSGIWHLTYMTPILGTFTFSVHVHTWSFTLIYRHPQNNISGGNIFFVRSCVCSCKLITGEVFDLFFLPFKARIRGRYCSCLCKCMYISVLI